MTHRPKNNAGLVVPFALGLLLWGCGGGGPSEAEFVEACLKEGQNAASQMLDRELGVTRDQFCTCGAAFARTSLSADGYRAMILDMQGRGAEARSITATMSESEQEATVRVITDMMVKCAGVQ